MEFKLLFAGNLLAADIAEGGSNDAFSIVVSKSMSFEAAGRGVVFIADRAVVLDQGSACDDLPVLGTPM